MNDVEPTVKSMREVIEGIELNGEKVFLLVADLGQKRVAGFFSNVVKGVEDYACEWVRWPAVQVYWKLIRRGCNVEDVKTMITECFDPAETIHIPSSRWSKTYKRAIVDTTSNFDLEAMLGMSGMVDFSKGRSNEERKERSRKKGTVFGAMGSNDFAAPNMSEEVSIKTTNPHKKKPPKKKKKKVDDNSIADTVVTMSGNTTVAQKALETAEDDGSLSTICSNRSVELSECMDKIYNRNESLDESEGELRNLGSNQSDGVSSDVGINYDQECNPSVIN